MIMIYLSGIDGCGKTTQAGLLVDRMNKSGLSAEYRWLRWEPSILPVINRLKKMTGKPRGNGVAYGQNVGTENAHHSRWSGLKRKIFSYSLCRRAWLSYASGDYFRSYRDASQQWSSDYIILDRYLLDFVIDQSLNLSIPPNEFQELLGTTALAKTKTPDMSIFIDLPAEVGYKRKLDGTPLRYLQEREQLYRDIVVDGPILHVDGTLTPADVHEQIAKWVYGNIGCDYEQ
ncbi:MAG: hypothetical protein OER80_02385 [Gammaproteobacteria bacterium]|nr:hypothetical protein [Gammaproteobacteria bacterium]MDH3768253.1 hypothetical protein [Gammaproteobacteria bacterium]